MAWSKAVKNFSNSFAKRMALVGRGMSWFFLSISLIGIFFGYRSYVRYGNERAHVALSDAMVLFNKAQQGSEISLWNDAEKAFAEGYKNFSGSALGSYFLAFQAEIALMQDNREKAISVLSYALACLPQSSPLYNVYSIKLALMKIDNNDSQGREALIALAGNPKNNNRDMALYYQGLVEFDSGNRAQAEKIWNNLIEHYSQQSVWAQVAQAKLDYVV